MKKTENLRIKVASSYINSSLSVKNLGFILDNTLGIEKQMNYRCKSCYFEIRNIFIFRKYIHDDICKTLVQTLIISRLDYINSFSYNITLTLTNRMENNCAAHLGQALTKGNI